MSAPDFPIPSHEGETMFHHILHRVENFGGPMIVAFISALSRIPPLQILGAAVSMGWFVLACVRERRMWLERRDRKKGEPIAQAKP